MSKLMLGVAAAALAFALPAIAQAPQPDQWLAKLPAAPERDMIAGACQVCHNAERIVTAPHDAFEWDRLGAPPGLLRRTYVEHCKFECRSGY